METVLYEYEEVANKANIEIYVDSLTLEEDPENANSANNIDAVSTEYTKKASSKNVEELCTEDGSKYASSENMMHVLTEE